MCAAVDVLTVEYVNKHNPVVYAESTDLGDHRFANTKTVVIPTSPRAYKTARIRTNSEDPRDRHLALQTSQRSANGALAQPHQSWTCGPEGIPALQAFLAEQFPETGSYTLTTTSDAALAAIARQIEDGNVDVAVVSRLVAAMSRAGMREVADALAEANEDGLLAGLMERRRQQQRLTELRAVVEDPTRNENDIQALMKREHWLFGGQYITVASRRRLTVLHEVDIPLVRADGSLHIVELKQANIGDLVVGHRSKLVVGPQVNLAVGQVMNYLRTFDERRSQVKEDAGVDPRRATATVVIGHPMFAKGGADKDDIAETLRTYNSHLSRVEVITYKELLDGAERSFALTQDYDPSDQILAA